MRRVTGTVVVGDVDEEPMEYAIRHRGLPPRLDWYTAECLTCGATRPFRLTSQTAHVAITKHAIEKHGGLAREGGAVIRVAIVPGRKTRAGRGRSR